jgi:hypothetical protein
MIIDRRWKTRERERKEINEKLIWSFELMVTRKSYELKGINQFSKMGDFFCVPCCSSLCLVNWSECGEKDKLQTLDNTFSRFVHLIFKLCIEKIIDLKWELTPKYL